MSTSSLQYRLDAIMATAPQRLVLGGLAALVPTLLSIGMAVASERSDAWLVVIVAASAIGAAMQPDDHLGLVTIGLVSIHWLSIGASVVSPWAIVVAAGLLVFHSLLALMGGTPHTSTLPRGLFVVWLRRLVFVLLPTIGVWLLVTVLERRDIPGNVAVSVAAFAALTAAVVLLQANLRRQP